jgi:hypothetical protein
MWKQVFGDAIRLLLLLGLLIDDDTPLASSTTTTHHLPACSNPIEKQNNITTWLTTLFNLCSSLSPLAFNPRTPLFGSRGRDAKEALSGAAFALTVQPCEELRCPAARF